MFQNRDMSQKRRGLGKIHDETSAISYLKFSLVWYCYSLRPEAWVMATMSPFSSPICSFCYISPKTIPFGWFNHFYALHLHLISRSVDYVENRVKFICNWPSEVDQEGGGNQDFCCPLQTESHHGRDGQISTTLLNLTFLDADELKFI